MEKSGNGTKIARVCVFWCRCLVQRAGQDSDRAQDKFRTVKSKGLSAPLEVRMGSREFIEGTSEARQCASCEHVALIRITASRYPFFTFESARVPYLRRCCSVVGVGKGGEQGSRGFVFAQSRLFARCCHNLNFLSPSNPQLTRNYSILEVLSLV